MSDTGLTLTQQPPVAPDITITADDTAPRLWQEVAMSPEFQRALVDATGQLVGDLDHDARRETALYECGATAMNGVYAGLLPSLADHQDRQFWTTLGVTAEFGRAGRNLSGESTPLEAIESGPLAVLAAAGVTPILVVEIGPEFEALRSEYQREICETLLSSFANAFDVSIVAGRATAAKFAHGFHDVLPGVSAPGTATRAASDVTAAVEQAHADLDPDSREVALLRSVVDAQGESRSYAELYSEASAGKSRVRQCLSRLADLDLVATFDGLGGKAVEALAAAPEFVADLDATVGRQVGLEDRVSESRQSNSDSREYAPAHTRDRPGPQEGGERHRLPSRHQVRSLGRSHAAATAAVAVEGGVATVDHPWEAGDDRGEPGFYYDEGADRLVVSAEYDSSMQWWVCVARALASPWTFRHVLPPERFDGEDADDRLAELFTEHRWLLHNARCVGYLDGSATGEEFVEALRDAEEHLCELTRRWHHGEYECSRGEYRGIVTREAHGLAGTMMHLLDLAGVDVVREARIPRYRQFDDSNKHDLAETLAVGASIQSRYEEFAANRQLFEDREDHRERAITPSIDAADPLGELIGSIVVSGPGVDTDDDDLSARISRAIDHRERHEDAPDFAIHVPIDANVGERRSAYAQAVRSVCDAKDLTATRTPVSWCYAYAGTPYDAADALGNLAPETKAPGSKIEAHEVRYALSTLDAERLLPDEKPTIGAMLSTLFTTDAGESLSTAALAERAEIAERSVKRHADRLEAFGLVERTDVGWRLHAASVLQRHPRMARAALDAGGHTENIDGGITMGWPATGPIERLADRLDAGPDAHDGPLASALWRLLGPPDPDDPVDTGEPPTPSEPHRATFGDVPKQQTVAEGREVSA